MDWESKGAVRKESRVGKEEEVVSSRRKNEESLWTGTGGGENQEKR